jgi:DNA-binding response OmpR family regulator
MQNYIHIPGGTARIRPLGERLYGTDLQAAWQVAEECFYSLYFLRNLIGKKSGLDPRDRSLNFLVDLAGLHQHWHGEEGGVVEWDSSLNELAGVARRDVIYGDRYPSTSESLFNLTLTICEQLADVPEWAEPVSQLARWFDPGREPATDEAPFGWEDRLEAEANELMTKLDVAKLLAAVRQGFRGSRLDHAIAELTREFNRTVRQRASLGKPITPPRPTRGREGEARQAAPDLFSNAPEAPPGKQLELNPDTYTVTLRGKSYRLLPQVFRLFQVLAAAEGRPLPGWKLRQEIGCNNDTTLDRWIRRLPPALRRCIGSRPGSGRWLRLPG